MHQMKFVVNPPRSSTIRTGSPCQRVVVPCWRAISLIGSPAASPYEKPGGDDPAEEATRQPVSFPGPLADKPVGDVKAARCQPAEPVEENAEERIGGHGEWSVVSGEWSVASAERVVPVDSPMNSSQLVTCNSQLVTRHSQLIQDRFANTSAS